MKNPLLQSEKEQLGDRAIKRESKTSLALSPVGEAHAQAAVSANGMGKSKETLRSSKASADTGAVQRHAGWVVQVCQRCRARGGSTAGEGSIRSYSLDLGYHSLGTDGW